MCPLCPTQHLTDTLLSSQDDLALSRFAFRRNLGNLENPWLWVGVGIGDDAEGGILDFGVLLLDDIGVGDVDGVSVVTLCGAQVPSAIPVLDARVRNTCVKKYN